jgi:hypothetical protein
MTLLKILLAVIVGIVAFTLFGKIRQKVAANAPVKAAAAAASAKDPSLSPAGFFLLTRAEAANPRVTIMSPPNCPSDEAARAEALAASLASAGIPTELKQEIGGSFDSPDDVARFNKYMTNVANPLVLVRGWAKGNPSAEDVIAQYRAGP